MRPEPSMARDIYPYFHPICPDVKPKLQQYIQSFPPYSDFNVWNILGWSHQDRTSYSFLNNNLVIRYKDWYENKYLYTLLGVSRIDHTLQILSHVTNQLEQIPEIVVQKISRHKNLIIEEDLDNHDYILSIEKLAKLRGNSFRSIRKEVSRFVKLYPGHSIRVLNFKNNRDFNNIIEISRVWCIRKGFDQNETDGEVEGIINFMKCSGLFHDFSVGLYLGEKIIGFTINELAGNGMAVGHIGVSDWNYKGSSKYIEHITAKMLSQKGCIYINYEQDMGIPGLRLSKSAYRPVFFLKKYKIRFAD